MDDGKNIFGNLANTDIQGNATDKNIQGERPKDIQGNPPKDIFGNETSGDKKDN